MNKDILMVDKIREDTLKYIAEKQKEGKSITEILEESRGFTITNTYYNNNFVNLNRNNENNRRTRAPHSSVGKRKKNL